MKLMFITFSFAVFLIEGSHACCIDYNNYYCYHWTQEDFEAMGPNPSVEVKTEQCKIYLCNKFTHGNNTEFPNCGTCTCCKPEAYTCYEWQAEDLEVLGPTRTIQQEELQCESHENSVFQGSNNIYQYCGDCVCCQPGYKCHFWTAEDREIMGPSPTWEVEKSRCEDDLYFLYTHGNNEKFPGTDGCWCIKPISE